MTAFSSEVRQAIEEGVEAGKKLMRETKRGKDVNGWEITLDMGRYGTRRGSGSVQCRRDAHADRSAGGVKPAPRI